MMFAVATAACLYYTGDYVGGSTLERALKVVGIRGAAFIAASAITYLLGFREPEMALMGGCCYSGGSPWNLFLWSEFCAWSFAVPVFPVLRTIRQIAPVLQWKFEKRKILSPRKKPLF